MRLAIVDESVRVATLLSEVADRAAGPEEAITELFTAFVHEASAPRLLTLSLRESPAAGELTDFLTDETAIAVSRTQVVGVLRRWQVEGQLPADLDLAIVGEMIARLMLSLIETPTSVIPLQDTGNARDFARTHLVSLLQTWRLRPNPAPATD